MFYWEHFKDTKAMTRKGGGVQGGNWQFNLKKILFGSEDRIDNSLYELAEMKVMSTSRPLMN